MGLQIFKISEYDHVAEREQFESIRKFLEVKYNGSSDECILIGNFNIEGVELDALLINNGGARIIEFKNWGGRISARENGAWTSNGMTIEGGAGSKTPYTQVRVNKSRASKGLKKLCAIDTRLLSACIIFWKNSSIDTTQLSSTVKSWLHTCDNLHVARILDGLTSNALTNNAIKSIPRQLGIDGFNINKTPKEGIVNETYEPEASTDLFSELEMSLKYIPNFSKVYNIYNRTFLKCLDQNTADKKLNLGGTFAKTDYLLKESHASRELTKHTNDTRVRLRKKQEIKTEDLKKWYLYDLRNLSEFIAFVYGVKVPETLTALFPREQEQVTASTLIGECLRVIVNAWDEEYVYATSEETDDGNNIKICYAHGNKFYDYDWTYLNGMFYKGAQLNLIRPRKSEDIYYPELIIFEPDYLVDISTVAKCFENYAESPFVNLIKKLQPAANSEPIILGNLAGQLLDEQIHQLPNTRSYLDSVTEFWKKNALSLLTVKLSNQFHSDANMQKTNIANAMGVVLPQEVSCFNPKEGMVEPSFFSEMLGLQGRMDYLQLDYKLLLEQKSGKGEFPYGNFIKPKQKEEHYVQMLLYMMLIRYNFCDIYERNHKELSAFILYSKYKESLLGLGFAPELIFRALKVRNGLTWTGMLYTQENGIRILETITPEKMNMKQVDNALWTNFQYKQIADVLSPIQQASDIEKAYYFRFMTFIANEHVLSKLGNKTKENSGFASKWYDSLEDKLQAGNIYDGLTLISPSSSSEGNVSKVILRFSESLSNNMSNFRAGDIVILYSYEKGKEPDARKTMVFRCTIKDIGTDTIELSLRATQSDAKVFLRGEGKLWAIEHDFMESSYSSLYRGMHAFLSAPKSRKDLLLLQRTPEVDTTLTLNGDYGAFNDLSLRVKRSRDLFLIIGPPGTGKTSFGLLNTLKEELTEANGTVLLLSYTNRAVDEICSKLYKSDIDFIRLGSDISCSPEYMDKLLYNRAQNCTNVGELKDIIKRTRVFVATTTAMNSHIDLFKIKQFSLAIIDEASQILEPHLIGLLSAHNNGIPAISKFVMIGDHKQLPAVVQQRSEISRVQDVTLNEILLTDCRLSLFERLLRKYRTNPEIVYMLKKQGRMHHDIALFPNYTFYNNQLEEVPDCPHQHIALPLRGKSINGIDNLLETRRISFINAASPVDPISDKVNEIEANIISATVLRIYEREKKNFEAEETVGVIVPYRNQIATVRNKLDKSGIKELHDITIDTVERYQGSQRKYIVYGFTIQKYYQLNFLTNNVFEDWDGSIIDRKLNVAMTRAEEHLIMVGNAELLSNNFTFYKLIEFVKSKHGYFDIPHDKYSIGDFSVPEYEIDDIDLSKATYSTTEKFNDAFNKLVMQPIKEGSGNQWPEKVFGYDMSTNLNAIGYGRINFSNQLQMFDEEIMNPQRQVLLYCYYIMRQHYCSSRNLYVTYKDWLKTNIKSVNGRLHFIDIGCGPATCGLAFSEIFFESASKMVYTGIDVSQEMKRMGKSLIENMFSGNLNCQTVESFNSLSRSFWDGCSELSSMVIINISYFFSNISSQFAERLAYQIVDVMRTYPINKYVIFIQHSEIDRQLNSFKVFKRILSPYIQIEKEETTEFSYILNYKTRTLKFCYNIFTSK